MYTLINKIKILFNLICLFLAGLAVSTYLVWHFSPQLVERIDNKLVRMYVGHYKDRLSNIKQLEDIDSLATRTHLSDFLLDIKDIKKQDRIADIKSEAFSLIVDISSSINPSETLSWYDKWLDFDSRNLKTRLAKAKFLSSRGKSNESLAILKELYSKYPESVLVVKLYATVLSKTDKHREAISVITSFIEQRPTRLRGRWTFHWRVQQSGYYNRSLQTNVFLTIAPVKNKLHVRVAAPKDMSEIQFKIPDSYSGWCFSDTKLTFINKRGSSSFLLSEYPPSSTSSGIKWANNIFEISIDEPSFFWSVPGNLRNNISEILFQARAYDCSTRWIKEILSPQEIYTVLEKSSEIDNKNLAHFLRQLIPLAGVSTGE